MAFGSFKPRFPSTSFLSFFPIGSSCLNPIFHSHSVARVGFSTQSYRPVKDTTLPPLPPWFLQVPNPHRTMFIINLPQLFVFDQLLLEEALYRILPEIISSVHPSSSIPPLLLLNTHPQKNPTSDDYISARLSSSYCTSSCCTTATLSAPTPATSSPTTPPASPPPCIVLGISGKPSSLVNLEKCQNDALPLIKRFSGGGTVYIDSNVMLSSFILPPHGFTKTPPFPVSVIRWSAGLYREYVFNTPAFGVSENDYIFSHGNGDCSWQVGSRRLAKSHANFTDVEHIEASSASSTLPQLSSYPFWKVGGNAQSFSKHALLHHTSFLWNVDYEALSRYLQLPSRRPAYRGSRSHREFVIPIYPHLYERIGEDCQSSSEQHHHPKEPGLHEAPAARKHFSSVQPCFTQPPYNASSSVSIDFLRERISRGVMSYARDNRFECAVVDASANWDWFQSLVSHFRLSRDQLRSTRFVDGQGHALPDETYSDFSSLPLK